MCQKFKTEGLKKGRGYIYLRFLKLVYEYVLEPVKELLFWSVLINQPELIDIFLGKRCSYGIHDRLVLATIYKKIGILAINDIFVLYTPPVILQNFNPLKFGKK